jgi:plasmid stability protein
MSGLLIRNLPESLHDRLKARALANRRSITMEAISILEQVLDERAGTWSLSEIDQIRIHGKKTLSQDLLDEARQDGRP